MNITVALSISSMVRMKPGDMFYTFSGLSTIIDIGYKEGDPISGFWWRHEIRSATEEERIIYEVMRT